VRHDENTRLSITDHYQPKYVTAPSSSDYNEGDDVDSYNFFAANANGSFRSCSDMIMIYESYNLVYDDILIIVLVLLYLRLRAVGK
jgi:hypothetical protein